MSLLLDALQRARREARQTHDGVPDLDVAIRSSGEPCKVPMLRILVSVFLVVSLLPVAWFFWEFLPDSTSPPDRLQAVAPVVEAWPQSQPQPQENGVDAPIASGGEETPTQREEATAEATSQVAREVVALYQNSDAVSNNGTSDNKLASVAAIAEADTDDSPALDIEAMVRQAEQALGHQGLVEHTSPRLEDMSQSLKDALPTLMYLRHDYRSSGGSRVTINRLEAEVGDTVAPGVHVAEILTDAVVLRFQGQTFRLRALNSWVNL